MGTFVSRGGVCWRCAVNLSTIEPADLPDLVAALLEKDPASAAAAARALEVRD